MTLFAAFFVEHWVAGVRTLDTPFGFGLSVLALAIRSFAHVWSMIRTLMSVML